MLASAVAVAFVRLAFTAAFLSMAVAVFDLGFYGRKMFTFGVRHPMLRLWRRADDGVWRRTGGEEKLGVNGSEPSDQFAYEHCVLS